MLSAKSTCLALNMNCVNGVFYCILLSTFCWLIYVEDMLVYLAI